MSRSLLTLMTICALMTSCAPTAQQDPGVAARLLPVQGATFKASSSSSVMQLGEDDRVVTLGRTAQSQELRKTLQDALGTTGEPELVVVPDGSRLQGPDGKAQSGEPSARAEIKRRLAAAGWLMQVTAAEGARESGTITRSSTQRSFVLLSAPGGAMLATATPGS